jgi:hypothetical protein
VRLEFLKPFLVLFVHLFLKLRVFDTIVF